MLEIIGKKIITDHKSTEFVCNLDRYEVEKIYKTVEKLHGHEAANNAICGRIFHLEDDFKVKYLGG